MISISFDIDKLQYRLILWGVKKLLSAETPDPTRNCCPVLPVRRLTELSELAGRFKALADATRLQMLGLLLAAQENTLCACHIEARFDLSQPTISHHLKVLRDAGFVTSERRGSWVFYQLDRASLAFLDEFRCLFQR